MFYLQQYILFVVAALLLTELGLRYAERKQTTVFRLHPHISPKQKSNKCVSRTDTNPPFAFQTAFPRGTDFSVSTGRGKKLHTLLVSLYF